MTQGSPFPTARRPGASKTTSRASGFEQIFLSLFQVSRSKNFKILEVGQVMILRKEGKPCDIFSCGFLTENICVLVENFLEFVIINIKGHIDNKATLVQLMDWCQTGDKPLSELRMIQLCNPRPQGV